MTQLSSLFNTGKGSNYRYCDRGDPSSPDWDTGDLTTDNSWHDIDCSSIVSSDATAIIFNVYIKDDATNSYIQLRKNGNSNDNAVNTLRTQVANQGIDGLFCIPCDSNQVVEYRSTNTTFTSIQITILGWFIESGTSGGDVLSNANITDNVLIRGDGGAKKIQECSTITVDDSGRMVNTGQPCFSAYLGTTESDCTGDGTQVESTDLSWTEILDQSNNFSNGTFTAPVTGIYKFVLLIYFKDLSASNTLCRINVVTSNRSYYLNYQDIGSNVIGSVYRTSCTFMADMDANDTMTFNVTVFGDTKVVNIEKNYTFIQGFLIC